MVEELVLAIDPFLSKVEQVILWENKAKSGAVFTASSTRRLSGQKTSRAHTPSIGQQKLSDRE